MCVHPPIECFYSSSEPRVAQLEDGGDAAVAWRVVEADFVTTDSGTGIVHIAPAFGEVDYGVLMAERDRFKNNLPPLLNCVAPDGTFTDEFPSMTGRFVKECDRDLTRDIRGRGLLVHQEQYLHDYPFCWRADNDPLIQYPRASWFIRTSEFRNELLSNNSHINWMPEHIKDGRFGNFLENNVDWALSRERYWGTPLPIWVCEETGKAEAVSSYDELLAKPGATGSDVFDQAKVDNPDLSEDLRVHKPYIDAITYDSPFAARARMRRVPEVIDCWFDSGAMPFAQWGWPHTGVEDFQSQWPADFISEAIDQTRGWFYSQLAISTLLFGPKSTTDSASANADAAMPPKEYPHPFRNCIVLGHMLGEDGAKMSKSKRNYKEPSEILDRYGADALRWYFFAGQPPWNSIRYSEQAIRESIPEFLLRLWNVYSFFIIYANIDGFNPATDVVDPGQLDHANLTTGNGFRPAHERSELDRWMLAELHATGQKMVDALDSYDHYVAAGALSDLVDAVSNWFVRRSRDRFWAAGKANTSSDGNPEKCDAYWTLYEVLTTTARLAAPFVPFVSEAFWQNLAVGPFGNVVPESIHLTDYPTANKELIDPDLARQMALIREVASLGRAARAQEKLKVRQPLSKVEVILADSHKNDADWLTSHADLVCDELNVKAFEICAEPDRYITRTILPDLKKLGPRLGKKLPLVRNALQQGDADTLMKSFRENGQATVTLQDGTDVSITKEECLIRTTAREGLAAAEGTRGVVVISSELTPELIAEGRVREVIHAIQSKRKTIDLEFTDRVALGFVTESDELREALQEHTKTIATETLAVSVDFEQIPDAEEETLDLDGHALTITLKRVATPETA